MMTRRTLIASVAALGAVGYGLWPRMSRYRDTAARQRAPLSASPDQRELIRMATLAANGHNTQPWRFRAEPDRIAILPDLSRRTPVVDPDDHHLYVSLGCAAENLALAAAAAGKAADVRAVAGEETLVEVALEDGAVERSPLVEAIPFRQSTRSVYDGKRVPSAEIARLTGAARVEGVSVLVFTEPADLETIMEAVVAGNSRQMEDPAFMAELRDWLRFSPEVAAERGDGLFSACSGNPAVPEWAGSLLFKLAFTKDGETDKYRDHVRSSAGIAVFVADQADPEHWMRAGRSFQRFALEATALGIRTAHLNQPVEVPEVRSEFAGWLGMPGARPDLVVRFGRAPALPMSLRRPVEAVLA